MNHETNQNMTSANLTKTRRMVLTGLFFAVALVLSMVENSFAPLPLAVPGVKFGLSNIAVMYALFFLGVYPAIAIAGLKALFVVIIRGPVAGFLSACGGLLSVAIMALLILIFKDKISYLLLSIFGAIFHNVGQFTAVSIIYTSLNLWVYLPVLLISGVFAGLITSTLLKVILPALQKVGLK
ncbi:Gx transporter family protein [Oscillospiraceae bacterium PP1C4]